MAARDKDWAYVDSGAQRGPDPFVVGARVDYRTPTSRNLAGLSVGADQATFRAANCGAVQ